MASVTVRTEACEVQPKGCGKAILAAKSWVKSNETGKLRCCKLGVAGEERGGFDDGVGEKAHGADKGFDEARIKLRAGAAFEFG